MHQFSASIMEHFRWFVMLTILAVNSHAFAEIDIRDHATRIGKGVNFGNTLEAPNEGEWGFSLASWHFEEVASAGFDSIRVPIRWTAHARQTVPYTVDASFFRRIDWVIDQAKRNHLAVVVDMHHYDEIFADPAAHRDRFVEIWRQIADRYKNEPDTVYFELLNEPNTKLDSAQWNSLVQDTLSVVRQSNPDRPIIVGPVGWNSVNELDSLELPAGDRNLIGTFHYYSPFEFTHQGAEWVAGSDQWLGTFWRNTARREQAIRDDFEKATEWSRGQDRPVFIGEFGAYGKADMDSRAAWTKFVADEADKRGFTSTYWEFGAGFGVYDRNARKWVQPLRDALSPQSMFDLNADKQVNRDDFQTLARAVQSNDVSLDLTNDKLVNQEDLEFWSYFAGGRAGDFDTNGLWDDRDIDLLGARVLAQTNDPRFDLNHDHNTNEADRRLWVREIVNTYFGDANLDGRFDSQDLIVAFQAGQFEDGIQGNSGWATGDWTGDGEFDTADFVLSFQDGGYDKGPRPTAKLVPEPNATSCLWLLSALSRRWLGVREK